MRRAAPVSRFARPAPRRPRRPRAAFTLLELIIATAIGAVVLLVIQTTFFGALRLHNTTHARIEQDRVLERALGFIRRDFAGVLLPGGTLSGEFQTSEFSSLTTGSYGERITPDLFTSSARIDGWSPFSEAQMVAYYLADGDTTGTVAASGTLAVPAGSKTLVRVVTRNLLPVQENAPDEVPLLPGVASAAVFYHDGTGWTDFWDSATSSTLPRAVKFSLQMAAVGAGDPPAPIEIVIPITATTTTTQTETAEAEAGL